MEVEVAVLGSPSPISLMVSVDVKQHVKKVTGYVIGLLNLSANRQLVLKWR